tara:strand:- start:796 stop:1188 length:393 start_codon:yes stop_codon:yes gene_type:complete
MLQQDNPDDYVIATGKMVSVREFIELCAKKLGWNKNQGGAGISWEGSGIDEIGRRVDTNEVVIRIDKRYFRPTEVDELLGDSSKAKKKLNWEPKITLLQLVSEMIEEDLKEAKKDAILKMQGFSVYSSKE